MGKITVFIISIFLLGTLALPFSVSAQTVAEGDLVSASDSFDIYIIKIVGVKKFKRLILNPDIFNSYGHLRWEDVKTISQTTLDEYTSSELVIEVNPDGSVADPKVYKVASAPNSDIGERQWLNVSAPEFEALGYDWDSVYYINQTEASPDFYTTKTPLNSFTPEEVLAQSGELDSIIIEVTGIISMVPFIDKFGLGGASPEFVTKNGSISMSTPTDIYDFIDKSVIVRGIYKSATMFLSMPYDCQDCGIFLPQ